MCGPFLQMTPGAEDGADNLEIELRQSDPWRWASSRFVGTVAARAALVGLYALDNELSRIPTVTSQLMLGEIRFAWWRERMEALLEGGDLPGHPVLQALAAARDTAGLDIGALLPLIDARARALDPEPIPTEQSLADWLDASSGVVMRAALGVLGPGTEGFEATPFGRVWGLERILTGAAAPALGPGLELAPLRIAEMAKARRAARRVPAMAFPAIAHLAASGREDPLTIRLCVMAAVALGRI